MSLRAPEPLSVAHRLESFDCGVDSLNDWLRRRALANADAGASRTFVVAEDLHVVGYYALAASGIGVAEASGRFRRNMPDPVPVALLARLEIHRPLRGQGLGRALFRDAATRVLNAADTLGIRGLIVHAISDEARAFYLALGFEASPLEPMTLMVTLADVNAALGRLREV